MFKRPGRKLTIFGYVLLIGALAWYLRQPPLKPPSIPLVETPLREWSRARWFNLFADSKLGHALGVSERGWYLLEPPQSPAGDPLDRAPLSQWSRAEVFDSAADCQARYNLDYGVAQTVIPADYAHKSGDTSPGALHQFQTWLKAMRCVAADDPQLS